MSDPFGPGADGAADWSEALSGFHDFHVDEPAPAQHEPVDHHAEDHGVPDHHHHGAHDGGDLFDI
jgi:hypothetical protein